MPEYHEDSVCAACDGPLEDYRDAICESCAPQSQYFEECAAAQEFVLLESVMDLRGGISVMGRWRRRLKFRKRCI